MKAENSQFHMTSEAVACREIPNIVTVMINHTIGHSFKILRVEMLHLPARHADKTSKQGMKL